ncbi:MAG: tripartite tricarboxylate transporter permease [Spirochaetales bacterium]|jgi:putative tricarboxylic transport membrane protein|nr:tripartite tricarboxylate transporter permease [Spirochaetales bacterium]
MNFEILMQVFQLDSIGLCIAGTILGIIFGAVPGLNATIGVSLLLPITFMLSPTAGLLMLGGIYMGGMYGGSITAVLINVPGAIEATCTAWEGYPMTLQGRSREALYYSIFASTFGGMVGILCLIFLTPPLAQVALKFGPPEMLIFALCGLAVVGVLASKNLWKSLFAMGLGLFLHTIGMDSMTTLYRFTFGIRSMASGLDIVAIVLGFFCFAEMFRNIGQKKAENFVYRDIFIKRSTVIIRMLKKWTVSVKASLIGLLIGILPGIGGGTAIFVAYGEAKRSSKNPELFGKGNVDGIIAAESANNAVVGGSLIPLLALGIPGSPTAAIIGAALTSHGLIIGPSLFLKSADVAYIFMYGMTFAVIGMMLVGTFGINLFPMILKINMFYLIPIVMVFALFGAYSINYNTFDVFVAVIVGAITILLVRFEIPLSPILIGFVLERLIEENFRRSLIIATAQKQNIIVYILTRPLSIILGIVLIVFIVYFFGKNKNEKKEIESN